MCRTVKMITLIFGNADSISVPVQYFSRFDMENIQTDLCLLGEDTMRRLQSFENLTFQLKASAGIDDEQFEQYCEADDGSTFRLFPRLLEKQDLSMIQIDYLGEPYEAYGMPCWDLDEDGAYINRCQRAQLEKDGSLTVRIIKSLDDEWD